MGMYKAKPRLVDLYTEDPSIFANLIIPEGLESATENAIIMQECGELQTVFDDAASLIQGEIKEALDAALSARP